MPENVLTVSLFVIPSKSLCGMLQVPAVEVWMEPGKGWEPQALISLMSKCLHSKKKPKHTTQTHTLSLSHTHNYTDIKKVLDTTHTTQTNATTYTYDCKPSPKRCHHIRGCEGMPRSAGGDFVVGGLLGSGPDLLEAQFIEQRASKAPEQTIENLHSWWTYPLKVELCQ